MLSRELLDISTYYFLTKQNIKYTTWYLLQCLI